MDRSKQIEELTALANEHGLPSYEISMIEDNYGVDGQPYIHIDFDDLDSGKFDKGITALIATGKTIHDLTDKGMSFELRV